MKYKEALEMNESKTGIDYQSLSIESLMELIDDIPGWDYPLAEDCMEELSRRADIDRDAFFAESDRDYSDLWAACAEKLGIEF